jgi:hypothetical protein
MTNELCGDWLDVYRCWSQTLANVVSGQLGLLTAPPRVAGQVLDGMLHVLATRRSAAQPGELERQVVERVRQGRAPPPEIYDVHNRDRVDWTRLPDWARPVDPELFGGNPHEG